MDLGEIFFKWLHSSNLERKSRRFLNFEALDLEACSHLDRLELVCQTLTDGNVRIHLSDGLEFPDPTSLFLPRKLSLARDDESNFAIYLYRVMVFHSAIQDGPKLTKDYSDAVDALMRSALVLPSVHRNLARRYAGFTELFARVCAITREATSVFLKYDPRFLAWAQLTERALSLEDFSLSDSEVPLLSKKWRREWLDSPYCPLLAVPVLPCTRLRATGAADDSNANLDKLSAKTSLPKATDAHNQAVRIKTVARPEVKTMSEHEENPMTHVFEKLLTAEEHKGGSKAQDGSDESEAHADALSELTLDSVVRTQTSADSISKSNAQIDSFALNIEASATNPQETAYAYPEWFEEERRYKPSFCTVYESVEPSSSEASTVQSHATHKNLSEKLSSFLNESRWKPRQKEGAEFDLDAVVRWRSQLHSSGPVDQHLYMGRRHLERNLAILILLDSSLSTDAWIGNSRVLDVMRSSIDIIGGAFAHLDDRFAIAAFNSHSRHRCNFKWLKRFDDSWAVGRTRLNSVRPDGYTRIGPALRHAYAVLDEIKARRKLILLFSDAKPSDYDRYEGFHGLSDVRKVVKEIKSRGIFLRGISVSQETGRNLIHMFGSGQYKVLSDPRQIADQVLQIFIEMMRLQ